jgi:hypothetical protein
MTQELNTHGAALAALLQTDQPDEQIKRLQTLSTAVSTPAYSLVITLDPREGVPHIAAFTSFGQPVSIDAQHQLIEAGRRRLVEIEREIARQSEAHE